MIVSRLIAPLDVGYKILERPVSLLTGLLRLYNKSCGKISQAIFLHKKILPSIM